MKNEYYNSYSAQFPIRDGHNWEYPRNKAPGWDGAECQDCGVVASNHQIACRDLPPCTVPVPWWAKTPSLVYRRSHVSLRRGLMTKQWKISRCRHVSVFWLMVCLGRTEFIWWRGHFQVRGPGYR